MAAADATDASTSAAFERHAPGQTGAYIAANRALESERTDEAPLFSDPLARAFAGAAGFAFVEGMARHLEPAAGSLDAARTTLANAVAVRTLFLDAQVARAVAAGARQVVLLAAGGDARAWRLPCLQRADAAVFAVDLPEVMARRREAAREAGLAPPACRAVEVEADLADPAWPAALEAAGYRRDRPAVWLVEGLLMYLPRAAAEALLRTVAAQREGDAAWLAVAGDALNEEFVSGESGRPILDAWERHGQRPVTGFDRPEDVLLRAGFQEPRVLEFGEEGADFGRVSEASRKFYLEQCPRGDPRSPPVPRNLLFHAALK